MFAASQPFRLSSESLRAGTTVQRRSRRPDLAGRDYRRGAASFCIEGFVGTRGASKQEKVADETRRNEARSGVRGAKTLSIGKTISDLAEYGGSELTVQGRSVLLEGLQALQGPGGWAGLEELQCWT